MLTPLSVASSYVSTLTFFSYFKNKKQKNFKKDNSETPEKAGFYLCELFTDLVVERSDCPLSQLHNSPHSLTSVVGLKGDVLGEKGKNLLYN